MYETSDGDHCVLYLPAYPVGLCAKYHVIVPLIGGNGRKIGCSEPITLINSTGAYPARIFGGGGAEIRQRS